MKLQGMTRCMVPAPPQKSLAMQPLHPLDELTEVFRACVCRSLLILPVKREPGSGVFFRFFRVGIVERRLNMERSEHFFSPLPLARTISPDAKAEVREVLDPLANFRGHPEPGIAYTMVKHDLPVKILAAGVSP
jgi:hypothetical protein